MSKNEEKLKKLKDEAIKLYHGGYTSYDFEISDENNLLCINQERGSIQGQKIVIQYYQVEIFVECINAAKENFDKLCELEEQIKELEKEINA